MSQSPAERCPVCQSIETIVTASVKDDRVLDIYGCLYCDSQFTIERKRGGHGSGLICAPSAATWFTAHS